METLSTRMRLKQIIKGLFNPLALLLLLGLAVMILWPESSFAQEIGQDARNRQNAEAGATQTITKEKVEGLITWVKVLGGLLGLAALILFSLVAKLVNFNPFRGLNANKTNAVGFVLFGIGFAAFIGWELVSHMPHILPASASEHGAHIDRLFMITLVLTGIVFVITQVLAFVFPFKYRYRENRKALFYADNHKLEQIWTIIPAVAMTGLVLYGVTIWYNVHHPTSKPEERLQVELCAEQFQWRIRFAGKDNKLGRHEFKKISTTNPLGVDSTDTALIDDVIPQAKEMHFPIGKPVEFKIRSKDVLHGVYAPHFAVNIYAIPGMPTNFVFTPTKTTAQMRKELNNPEFNYELACSQLCGSSHYNMRVVIVIDTPEDYNKWLTAQNSTENQSKNLASN